MPAVPLRSLALKVAETLLIAFYGGATLTLLRLPGGWISGALLFVAIAALCGRPMEVPPRLAQVLFVAMGITLGGVVTPETLRGMAAWPVSILTLLAAGIASTYAGWLYLTRVHGWDSVSAFCASTPGSLTQALIYATEERANVPAVAIIQAIRNAILSIAVPVGLGLVFGAARGPVAAAATAGNTLGELALLVAGGSLCSFVLYRLRFPAGLMFGAMLFSAVLHGTGFVHTQMPGWITIGVMCGLGAMIGARFANTSFRLLMSYIVAALGLFGVTMAVAMVFALAITMAMALHTSEVVVSYVPGALDVMMMLSLTLHLDPVFVGAHHVSRFIAVSLLMPAGIRLAKRARLTPPRSPGP